MSTLVSPHGSAKLRPLLLEGAVLDAERTRAESLPAVRISSREAGDVVMMGIGGFTPLAGFMGSEGWRSVCDHMRMSNGVFWPIPITLRSLTRKPGNPWQP
jgi:sulfate adenylyltransferase